MALNFPNPNTNPIYIDPISGLKYIYNNSVKAWESAIQPPAIIASGEPADIKIDGFLWYDSDNQTLYVLHNGVWQAVSNAGGQTPDLRVRVSETMPTSDLQVGDLWWDSVGGQLYIYYIDVDSNQFVPASPTLGTGGNANVTTSDSPPTGAIQGDMWFNTSTNVIYVYHNGAWVPMQSSSSGVDDIVTVSPLTHTESNGVVTLRINTATASRRGSVRMANQAEVDTPSISDLALNPSRLANALKDQAHINEYLPDATELAKGITRFATSAEASAGTLDYIAISPATLSDALQATGNPPGTIIAFAGTTAPLGYLLCNGDEIEDGIMSNIQGRTNVDTSDLYSIIYGIYGNPSAALLPDLRGDFLRGWSNGKPNVDPNRTFGTRQVDTASVISTTIKQGSAGPDITIYGANDENVGTDPNGETRPRNVAILYCIKL